jgi:hypothetical protein
MKLLPGQMMARASLALQLLGIVIAFAFVFSETETVSGVLSFGLWAAGPFLLIGILSYLFQNHTAPIICLVIATILLILSSVLSYSHISRDAQGGLIFVVLPLYQLLFSGVVALIALTAFIVMRNRALDTR